MQIAFPLQPVVFSPSPLVPLAVGFFGLGTGYLIYGPQELFDFPRRNEAVDRSTGTWGIWMPGFMQFITGVYLWIGITWFNVFKDRLLYMAALAFTAYGVHWFAIGWGRYVGGDPRPNGFMSIAFTFISALGAVVFFLAGDVPVGGLFIGLGLIYISDFFASLRLGAFGERSLGFWHLMTGMWLMYLTWAATLNLSLGYTLPL